MSEELAIIPRETALQVFTQANGLDPYLTRIRQEIEAFKPDITTKKGRDAIASMAYKVAQSKSYLEGIGKELADEQKEIPKKIDASRKKVRDTLDAWKDEVRKPLTDWENAEKARCAAHEVKIARLNELAAPPEDTTSEQLIGMIQEAEAVEVGPQLQEFEARMKLAKNGTLAILRVAHAGAVRREEEAATAERERQERAAREQREREARIAADAAERARKEAEATAERQRQEAIAKAAAEAQAAERAAQAKLDAERTAKEAAERQAAQAEQQRKEAEARAARAEHEAKIKAEREQQEKAEAEARERDKVHKTKINRAALDAFVKGGMNEETAKLAVTLIAGRKIPAVSISY